MTLVPKREYALLLIGDIVIFVVSLWLTLCVRYLSLPTWVVFRLHLIPFSLLFVVWIVVFFLAGLYWRYTRLFRSKLVFTILSTQTINMALAALFFFFVPAFGIAPKTNLLLYLVISFVLIYLWRVALFPRLRTARRLRGVLIASGPEAQLLAKEIASDPRSPFSFDYVIDTAHAPSHEVIQRACRVAAEKHVSFIVADFSDAAISAAMPIIYDAAFHKHRFALIDIVELYQEVFHCVPLSLTRYEWILGRTSVSRLYDTVKRVMDIVCAIMIGVPSLLAYPFVALAIKMDDGEEIFITQERVGRFQKPIRIIKFRSMSGNDEGKYGENGKTILTITRVGKWLRLLRVDELPQLWNVLRGDLSLVGPRPDLPTLAAHYNARIPYHNARYFVAPGLTGWAQIKYDTAPRHGVEVLKAKEKLSYDLYYLRHRSLMLDIYILSQTIRVVLSARGT